jgi:hypothetical protein
LIVLKRRDFTKMPKIIIKLLAVTLVGGIGIIYYVWQQAIKVPDEYLETNTDQQENSLPLPSQPIATIKPAAVIQQKITMPIVRAKVGQKVTVKLNNKDLNNLVVTKLATADPNQQLPSGIKGIKTKIKDGKIYVGALVNLDRLAQDQRSSSQSAALGKITEKLTFLKDRDVYVGITGKPIIAGDRLKFAPDTQIKLGNMSFTIDQLAENLGVAPAKIQQAIDLQLSQQNFKIDRINIDKDNLEIEGAKK